MLRTRNPFRSSVLLAALAPALAAQSAKVLPEHANAVDGHHSVAMPFGVLGFRTQLLLDATAVGPNGAVITGVRFRADRTSLPAISAMVPNVTIEASHTSAVVGTMSSQFAANVTSPVSNVFTGTVMLPNHTDGYAGPLGWDIVIQFSAPFTFTAVQGNLLLDIVGNNVSGGQPAYWLDAVQGGGSATRYGASGDDPSFDQINLIAATGNGIEPRLLTPGHVIDFTSTLSFTNPPGVLALGLVGLPVPFDLGLIGAPTNSLYIDPLVLSAHSWQSSFIGRYSTFSLAVPNDPLLVGTLLYGQSVLFEPAANALGLITSHAVEVRIGEQGEILPMQQLDANDPAATTGTLVDFGFGQPEYGAAAILLEGVFF
jgi:hypothetical protein